MDGVTELGAARNPVHRSNWKGIVSWTCWLLSHPGHVGYYHILDMLVLSHPGHVGSYHILDMLVPITALYP